MEIKEIKKISMMKKNLTLDYAYFKQNLDIYNDLLLKKHQEKEDWLDKEATDYATEMMNFRIKFMVCILFVLFLSVLPFFSPFMSIILGLGCGRYLGKTRRKIDEKYKSKAINLASEEKEEQVDLDTLYEVVSDARFAYHQARHEYENYINTLSEEDARYFNEYMQYIEYLTESNFADEEVDEKLKEYIHTNCKKLK